METINHMTNDQMMDLIIKNTLRQNYLLQNGDQNALNQLHKKIYKSIYCCNIPKISSQV